MVEYKCDNCGQKCASKAGYMSHMKRKTPCVPKNKKQTPEVSKKSEKAEKAEKIIEAPDEISETSDDVLPTLPVNTTPNLTTTINGKPVITYPMPEKSNDPSSEKEYSNMINDYIYNKMIYKCFHNTDNLVAYSSLDNKDPTKNSICITDMMGACDLIYDKEKWMLMPHQDGLLFVFYK
ncbi:MAG: hypothetical protein Edafosvirus15_1, partial [Edafosvirus sp.]